MQAIRSLLSKSLTIAGSGPCRSRPLSTTSVLNMPIQVGNPIPSVDLFEGDPGSKVNTGELFAKGKSVIFAVPGAFTPTCSKDHLPGYLENFEKFKSKGVDRVVCISVNDPFVMAAWGKNLNADGKIRMLADTCGDFSKTVGLTVDRTVRLGGLRSQRYAMVVTDGKVTALQVEPDGTGLSCSAAKDILSVI
ncbi:peroxiredoxin-5, mitochondrial isoform X2 [Patella vulgata]|uniref:peroxiredoxin-5, mitochondrial isoform X2 n=1 Tax=Patella vulgata TaxID=6465 RepID=UPI0021807A8F|nr:peroxiredoxin-5, mitochondrial isoform X2 [Patella vulgata]